MTSLEELQPSLIIFDRLNLEETFVKAIRENLQAKIVIIDNLSTANQYADVVINALLSNHFRNQKFIDDAHETLYFIGPRYLLLKQDFYTLRKELSEAPKEINKVLLLFGGSDPSNLTSLILDQILRASEELSIDVVIGPHFDHHDALKVVLAKHKKKSNRITLHRAVKDTAELIANTDLVITSPGMSMFEALTLSTPVITLYQNELQRTVYSDFFQRLGRRSNFLRFIRQGFYLDPKDPAIQALCIGKGKPEVIEAITNFACSQKTSEGLEVSIRQATDADLELMMSWRSHPLVYRYFYEQNKPLEWKGHFNWWKSRENRIDWIILLKEKDHKRAIGSVNVSNLDLDNPEVGIYIGEVTLWGKGIGRIALTLVLDWLKNQEYQQVQARIMKENLGSIKLFKAAGFKRVREDREGEWLYEKKL